jgi:hypothetical protein
MMDADERKAALRNIESVVPSAVFDRLINVLTMIEEHNNDALVHALSLTSTDPSHSFTYRMNSAEHKETITPIREILDLCEGWFITSKSVVGTSGRVRWEVESIIGRELTE